jgi:hypothetical protein
MAIRREDRNTIQHHYALAAQPLTTSSPTHPSMALSKDVYTQSSFEALSCTPEDMAPETTTIALSPIKSEEGTSAATDDATWN